MCLNPDTTRPCEQDMKLNICDKNIRSNCLRWTFAEEADKDRINNMWIFLKG
jgi:hypothetical protein